MLVELLMATSIAVIVGMVIYKALAGGISIWRWANEYRVNGDVSIFFSRISGDLDNNCGFSNYTFSGDQGRVSFFVHDPDYMDMSDKEIKASGKKEGMPIYRVEYAYVPERGDITRTTYRLGSTKPETQSRALSGVSAGNFEYYIRDKDTKSLMRSGSVSGRTPDGVGINFKLKDARGEDDIFRRIIEVTSIA